MEQENSWENHLKRLAHQALHDVQDRVMMVREHGAERREQAPIVRLTNELLEHAIRTGASDLHIEPQKEELRFRYRVDGVLRELHGTMPIKLHPLLVSRLKIMAGMDTSEHRKPLDGHLVYLLDGRKVDLRVASMPIRHGESIVLRIMNGSGQLRRMGELGMSEQNAKIFQRMVHAPSGMLILTGPMNSGKTTSLYAALQELNTAERNIVTLEDPVEQLVDGINQMEMNEKIGLDFAKGLRAMLRMDANCIMVGEARDTETAQIAVRAALTGHLLLTTLHARDSCSALFRLLEMGIQPYLLAATLTGIVAQRLVRCICPVCRESYEVQAGSEEAVLLGRHYHPGLRLYRGRGCPECHGTGLRGRMAIHEILEMKDALRARLLRSKEPDALRRAAEEAGLVSMQQDGVQKVLQGLTTIGEVRRALYGGD